VPIDDRRYLDFIFGFCAADFPRVVVRYFTESHSLTGNMSKFVAFSGVNLALPGSTEANNCH